jgi:hypothetical protein
MMMLPFRASGKSSATHVGTKNETRDEKNEVSPSPDRFGVVDAILTREMGRGTVEL